jgi:hypothetical protein
MGDSLLPSRPVLRITGIVWTIEIHQVVFFVECGRDLSLGVAKVPVDSLAAGFCILKPATAVRLV